MIAPDLLNKELYGALVLARDYERITQIGKYVDMLKAMKANPDFPKLNLSIRELIDELVTKKRTLEDFATIADDLRIVIDEQIHFFAPSK